MRMPRLAVTTGEPAGIGPEVSLRAALARPDAVELLGDRTLLAETADRLGIPPSRFGELRIRHVPLAVPARCGRLDVRNAEYVLEMLRTAHEGAVSGLYRGIVTGPVQKSVITEAGHPFTGHTEYFQERSGVARVVMMLVSSPRSDALKVALATTHLPIADLSRAITRPLLAQVLDVLITALKRDYRMAAPRIAVAGLNPHAGEDGHIGREEIETIAPALAAARMRHPDALLEGPLPADTLFLPDRLNRWDAVLCMYHDQGLPVLKHVGFAEGVNVTLGLPYVRTSVDHGTALDIAGKGTADARSMTAAIELAQTLTTHRETRMA